MAAVVHKPLEIREFNDNGFERQTYVVGTQLQVLRIGVAIFS
jgi:hypothetical protein